MIMLLRDATEEEAIKYGDRHYLRPVVRRRYNKITDEFMGFEVFEGYDLGQ